MEVWWRCGGGVVEVLWRCWGGAGEVWWSSSRGAMEVLWRCCGGVAEVWCGCGGPSQGLVPGIGPSHSLVCTRVRIVVEVLRRCGRGLVEVGGGMALGVADCGGGVRIL